MNKAPSSDKVVGEGDVCEKIVYERVACDKYCVRQSCVWGCDKLVGDKVVGVCGGVVFGKVVCDKAACEGEMRKIVQLCVTKFCVCHRILFERNGLACSVDVTKCHACHGKTKVQYGPCRQMPRLPRDSEPRASMRASGDHPPSSSARGLCVLCLSHDSQPRASDDHARSSSARKLCEPRLPHDSQPRASATPGGSVYGLLVASLAAIPGKVPGLLR